MKPELLEHELLVKARSLIEKPENWIQHQSCADAEGRTCPWEEATKLCTFGAMYKVVGGTFTTTFKPWHVLHNVAVELGYRDPISYNDHHSHAEVIAMWDTAIARAAARAR